MTALRPGSGEARRQRSSWRRWHRKDWPSGAADRHRCRGCAHGPRSPGPRPPCASVPRSMGAKAPTRPPAGSQRTPSFGR